MCYKHVPLRAVHAAAFILFHLVLCSAGQGLPGNHDKKRTPGPKSQQEALEERYLESRCPSALWAPREPFPPGRGVLSLVAWPLFCSPSHPAALPPTCPCPCPFGWVSHLGGWSAFPAPSCSAAQRAPSPSSEPLTANAPPHQQLQLRLLRHHPQTSSFNFPAGPSKKEFPVILPAYAKPASAPVTQAGTQWM